MAKYTANRTNVLLFEGKYYTLKKDTVAPEMPKKLIDILKENKSITKIIEKSTKTLPTTKKRISTRTKKSR